MPVDPAVAKSLFLELVAIDESGERAVRLRNRCGGDVELLARVNALLVANDRAMTGEGIASAGNPETAQFGGHEERAGAVLAGKYKLVEEIGEGGMGSVFMAQQTDPVKRAVAVKVIKAGMDSKAVLARFEAERQALAMMDHPNIARVLDAGTTEGGRPFFVMELVKGVPITRYCDEKKLTPRQRLELFVPVCHAIQHAHQKGVIHRDIKPSNVLVAMYDDHPVPKVIDFGVAKAAGQALTESTLMTGFGVVVGTPEYMSPEQASLNNLDIDTRSDVYSLGTLLYELLTGTTPVDRKALGKAAVLEILRIVREVEAPRPSAKLSTIDTLPSVAANRGTEPAKLSKLMKGELDWVVLKALEKDRTRRYDTANGLARDIQRYLADEVVEARPASTGYRLRKFVRRHKGHVVAAGLVLFALLAGIAGTTIGLIEARQQERAAVVARAEEAAARQREAERADAEARERKRADEEKLRAIRFRDQALNALRATTGTDVEKLIGSKKELSANERAYLEAIILRWQTLASQLGTDDEARAYVGEGHFRVADLWRILGRLEEARAELQAARDLQQKLVEQFPTLPSHQQNLANTHNNLGILLADLGKRDEALPEYQAARDLLKRLVQQFPEPGNAAYAYKDRLASTHNNLGNVLSDLGKKEEALSEYQAARELQKSLALRSSAFPVRQKNLASTHTNLGILLAELGRRDEARAEYESARNIRMKLVEQFPDVPEYQEGLALTHYNLGKLLLDQGKPEEALTEYGSSRALRQRLTRQFPGVPSIRQNLASTNTALGNILAALGKRDEALAEHQASRALREKLVEQFPAVPEYREGLAVAHFNIGEQFSLAGKRPEALAEYLSARDLRTKLAAQFPAVALYRANLADTCTNLGILLGSLGRWKEAHAELEFAGDLHRKLIEQHPSDLDYQIGLGGNYCNFGLLVGDEGKPGESVEWFDRGIRILQPLHDKVPGNDTAKQFLRNSYWSRARAHDQLHKYAESLRDWDRAVELSSPGERPGFRAGRALTRLHSGMVAEALADVSELTKLDNWTAAQWCDFASIYSLASGKVADKKHEYADRAMTLLRNAVKGGYKDAVHLKSDAALDALREREDFKKLVADLK